MWTFKSLMWRYSSIMAADFRTTSSSVNAGFGIGGGFVLLLYFAAGKWREIGPDKLGFSLLRGSWHNLSSLYAEWRSSPVGSLSWLLLPPHLSLPPLSLQSVTWRAISAESRLSRHFPPRSCNSLMKLRLPLWFWRPGHPSLQSNRSNQSLSRSLQSFSSPGSKLELDLNVLRHNIQCI